MPRDVAEILRPRHRTVAGSVGSAINTVVRNLLRDAHCLSQVVGADDALAHLDVAVLALLKLEAEREDGEVSQVLCDLMRSGPSLYLAAREFAARQGLVLEEWL